MFSRLSITEAREQIIAVQHVHAAGRTGRQFLLETFVNPMSEGHGGWVGRRKVDGGKRKQGSEAQMTTLGIMKESPGEDHTAVVDSGGVMQEQSLAGEDHMETADVQDEVILPSPTSTEARPVDTTAIIEPGENTATEIQAHAEHKSGIEPTSDEPPKQTVSPISTIPPITTKTNPLPTHETSSFRISPSPISGHGAFALRSLKGGTILLRERPLLIATKHTLFERFGELSAEERAVATSLAVCDAVKFGAPVIQGVYETNAFATNPSIHDAGLFPIAARFNHACHPVSNVVYHYDAEQDCLVLSVGEGDVAQGDELTISYGKEYTPLMLYTRYGFNCGCGACGGLSEEEIRELDPVW